MITDEGKSDTSFKKRAIEAEWHHSSNVIHWIALKCVYNCDLADQDFNSVI